MANRFTSVEAAIDQAAHGILARMPRGGIADGLVSNNTLYYSSTQSKLCYKDGGGTVHTLY